MRRFALLLLLAAGCASSSPRAPATSAPKAERVETARSGTVLRGTLLVPSGVDRFPAVVLAHGTGRLDRDGNTPGERGPSTYRLLAEALAARGIAVVRWDKRGFGESKPVTPEERTVDHLARDVAAWRDELKDDRRVCATTLVGHSEGGQIVMLALSKSPADALVTVGGSGRPLRDVLHQQVKAQVDAAAYEAFSRALDRVARGEPPGEVPEALAPLFIPRGLFWLRSELDVDPAKLAATVNVPMTIVQGDTDAQVSVEDDAKRLAAANPRAKLVVLPHVNHMLKTEAKRELPQASYDTPDLPLADGVADAVASGVARCPAR